MLLDQVVLYSVRNGYTQKLESIEILLEVLNALENFVNFILFLVAGS